MNNLGFLTDFKLLGVNSEVKEYADYFLVKTPLNPTFIEGNCMVLKSPKLLEDKAKLESRFKTHFETVINQHHVSFKLMSKPSDELLQVYLQDEYEYDKLAVMTYVGAKNIASVLEPKIGTIRTFNSNSDWEQWAKNEIEERPMIYTEASFKEYLFARVDVYKELAAKGFGDFYGVFENGELLASAGLYIFDEIGRFQQVRTMEKARRQGICKALIQFMHTQNASQMQEAVIVADEAYHALKLYEGLGFKSKQNQYDLTKVIKD
jgi:ribosomal protein S18 acetylase RimI-like enzyme